jgi:hypothetical protein
MLGVCEDTVLQKNISQPGYARALFIARASFDSVPTIPCVINRLVALRQAWKYGFHTIKAIHITHRTARRIVTVCEVVR